MVTALCNLFNKSFPTQRSIMKHLFSWWNLKFLQERLEWNGTEGPAPSWMVPSEHVHFANVHLKLLCHECHTSQVSSSRESTTIINLTLVSRLSRSYFAFLAPVWTQAEAPFSTSFGTGIEVRGQWHLPYEASSASTPVIKAPQTYGPSQRTSLVAQ